MKEARRLRDGVRRLIVTHGALEETKRPCGVRMSLPNSHALLELLSSDEPMTVSRLAERLAIDRTNVSRLCARMEESGELKSEIDPTDGRARSLKLTAHGRKLARSVDAASASHFLKLAQALGESAETVIDALELLEQAMLLKENEP